MVITVATLLCPQESAAESLRIDPSSLRAVAKVDDRFQSYNVEMAEVVGGKFWKPYAHMTAPAQAGGDAEVGNNNSLYEQRPPVDLNNPRLRALAAALGPAYIRVSGSWANTIYFHNDDSPPPAMVPAGYSNVLTRAQWRGVVEFARAIDAKLVTSFTISPGVRDASGNWTSVEAKPLVDYTRSIGGEIVAAELFNEPNFASHGGAPKGYNAQSFANDIAAFQTFVAKAAPGTKVVGPGDAQLGASLMVGSPKAEELMSAEPRPHFDIYSYHFYGAVSKRCAPPGTSLGITPEKALSEEWLARTDKVLANSKSVHERYAPGTPIWLDETAEAGCGGDPFAATFLDTFRYIDQMGRLAKQGVNAVFHNTLAASEYGLIDQATQEPRPSYWAALIWRRLMGPVVLDAGPIQPGFHVYAQCLRDKPHGVALVAINTGDKTETLSLNSPANVLALSAPTIESGTVLLNGRPLAVGADNRIPEFQAVRTKGKQVSVEAKTITFVSLPRAQNPSCP